MGAVFRPEDARKREWVRKALRDLSPEMVERVEELLARGERAKLEKLLGKERSRHLLEELGR